MITVLGVAFPGEAQARWVLESWTSVPNGGKVIAVHANPDGSLLAVGTDHWVYIRKQLSDPWTRLPSSKWMYGQSKWTKTFKTETWHFGRRAMTGPQRATPVTLVDIFATPSEQQRFFGLGSDGSTYEFRYKHCRHVPLPKNGQHIQAQGRTDGKVSSPPEFIPCHWRHVVGGGRRDLSAVAIKGSLVWGVDLQGELKSIPMSLYDNKCWQEQIAIVQKGGNFSRRCPKASWSTPTQWRPTLEYGCAKCATSAATAERSKVCKMFTPTPDVRLRDVALMPSGAVLGLGLDTYLYIRGLPSHPWAMVPVLRGSHTKLRAISVFTDHTIVGVTQANQLVRGKLSWKPAPQQLSGGTGLRILNAGYGHNCKTASKQADATISRLMTYNIRRSCQGCAKCTHVFDADGLGDPAFGCKKKAFVDISCNGKRKRVELGDYRWKAEGQSFKLSCP